MTLAQLIMRHEGLKLKPYRCPAGKLTIGVGRNLDDVGITEEEAMVLFKHDLERVANEAAGAFPWFSKLEQTRQDVVVSMIFNLGMTRLKEFERFLSAMAVKDYELAASEMLNSRWAAQVGKRAVELADMMRSGSYSPISAAS